MIHPTDDDPRVEFAGRWLNEQSPGSEFDVLASAQIGDTRAVVVADPRLAVIFYAQREEGRWALGQTAHGVELQAGPFATSGSFGPDNPEDWHMYVFGRVADPTGPALLIQGEHVEPLPVDEHGLFFQMRRMTHRWGDQLQVEVPGPDGDMWPLF